MAKVLVTTIALLLLGAACAHPPAASQAPLPPAQASHLAPAPAEPALYRVGHVTWHPQGFVNQPVRIVGYLLRREVGYLLFSDENHGPVTLHDLPVTGSGLDLVAFGPKYLLSGVFLPSGLVASNKNPYHLQLTSPPRVAP